MGQQQIMANLDRNNDNILSLNETVEEDEHDLQEAQEWRDGFSILYNYH